MGYSILLYSSDPGGNIPIQMKLNNVTSEPQPSTALTPSHTLSHFTILSRSYCCQRSIYRKDSMGHGENKRSIFIYQCSTEGKDEAQM